VLVVREIGPAFLFLGARVVKVEDPSNSFATRLQPGSAPVQLRSPLVSFNFVSQIDTIYYVNSKPLVISRTVR
jgi:hypothetical protein